ncbi:uncharacterized protein LOC106053932 isoform X11 [Biomphalaria glabrata]|uniref:Uncharacterized protein LOC106053932 isoform X11 n=1 Tax=Biomphalaria glabrata TaxID=6526 RepID=A0A9W3BHI0_BIOGL|nr:uncharacterized protein LOC106053932 isoform X11 [Biomphalaria glabrata]
MDFDSSSKFIASLAKFLQSLCNGYVDFDKGVEVIGHIYINVDSDTGKKVDYVLNEKVCKNDNSITFISNSFHAQPAEKPKPLPKKIPESEKQNEDTIVMEDSGPTVPNSTNVGTMGSFRNTPRGGTQDITFTPGSKRPRTPPLRRNLSSGKSGSPASKHMSPSTRYQDSGGPSTKISRSDIPPSPLINSGVGSEDYDNPNVFQSGGEEDDSQNYSSNFLEQNSSDLDQKPVIDPDISIVKEEYMSSQQNSCAYAGANQSSGSAPRGKHQQTAYPVMMHPNSSNYSGVTAAASHQSDSYSSASLEGAGDPSTLTRAQQEELEMYYRKGTDQHLTFLRNMREAHALYPFTGKRDKELFDKALAELFLRMPALTYHPKRALETFYINATRKMQKRRLRANVKGQFKSPGQGPRGQFGRQSFHASQGYTYPQGGYSGMSGHGMERRMSSAGSEGDSFLQGGGDESYDYQHLASDDSRDTQQGASEHGQIQSGFHGVFGNGSGQQEGHLEQPQPSGTSETAVSGTGPSPPDIKVEVTPYPFMKTNDFELIEIDPDDEDDI